MSTMNVDEIDQTLAEEKAPAWLGYVLIGAMSIIVGFGLGTGYVNHQFYAQGLEDGTRGKGEMFDAGFIAGQRSVNK